MLASLAAKTGVKVATQKHCPDNFDTLCAILRDAGQQDAVIITTTEGAGYFDSAFLLNAER